MNKTSAAPLSTAAIIRTAESDEALPCIVTGCHLDAGSDEGWAVTTWIPVWHMDGAVFLGMNCGGH